MTLRGVTFAALVGCLLSFLLAPGTALLLDTASPASAWSLVDPGEPMVSSPSSSYAATTGRHASPAVKQLRLLALPPTPTLLQLTERWALVKCQHLTLDTPDAFDPPRRC